MLCGEEGKHRWHKKYRMKQKRLRLHTHASFHCTSTVVDNVVYSVSWSPSKLHSNSVDYYSWRSVAGCIHVQHVWQGRYVKNLDLPGSKDHVWCSNNKQTNTERMIHEQRNTERSIWQNDKDWRPEPVQTTHEHLTKGAHRGKRAPSQGKRALKGPDWHWKALLVRIKEGPY